MLVLKWSLHLDNSHINFKMNDFIHITDCKVIGEVITIIKNINEIEYTNI